ncbi:ATPase subunit of ABC transporter with duplicated ATPase domains [Paenibacillus sp. PvR052]|nr:ATPase subunit of ABC transporter with duplicated ATPase domains [Paenibacillus sp. PvP091]MBP1172203.1 ATPase subunit of ABC transporter with duplicated ATPase domains [Paenibacillus sp. PvR098]MBP2438584.1 ATPase subunit of ABC transporter with duplicated ATPase domains [Paenibacillus sp. PvP052]
MSLINVSNLRFAYDGSYDNIFENVNFQIDTDWKLGFTGRNGRGKTTFLNLLLGKAEIFRLMSALNISLSKSKTRKIIPLMSSTTFCQTIHWQLMHELTLLKVS